MSMGLASSGTNVGPCAGNNAQMADTGRYLVHDLIVALDYGQFGIYGGYRPDVNYIGLLRKAQHGPGIASYECGVVVLSPHQNNVRYRTADMPYEYAAEGSLTQGGQVPRNRATSGGCSYGHRMRRLSTGGSRPGDPRSTSSTPWGLRRDCV